MGLVIIKAEERHTGDVFRLCAFCQPEVGIATIDRDKATRLIYQTIMMGHTFLAFHGSRPVGVIGLWKEPQWYSSEPSLNELFFFVLDPWRGKAGKALLKAAKDESDRTGMKLIVRIINPRKRRAGLSIIGETLGYSPIGPLLYACPED